MNWLFNLLEKKKTNKDTPEPSMRFLIAGLGNVGEEYSGTRHNIGFAAVEYFVQQHEGNFVSDRYAYSSTFRWKNKMLTVIKPATYMNLSGKAIRYYSEKFHIPIENILVISDDKDLPLGQLRIRGQGSGGSHNGINNIIELMHSSRFARLRIGIGNKFPKGSQIDFVLGKFSEDEKKILQPSVKLCSEIILSFIDQGIQKTMNIFNTKKTGE